MIMYIFYVLCRFFMAIWRYYSESFKNFISYFYYAMYSTNMYARFLLFL